MTNYTKIQFIGYGVQTSTLTQVIPTGTADPYTADATTRAKALCAAADFVRNDQSSRIGGDNTLKVFVAPEFFFRYGGPAQGATPVLDSYPNGDAVLPEITEKVLKPFFQTKEFNNWLVVPGTMFWHRPAADSGTGYPLYFNTVLALRGGVPTELSEAEQEGNRDPASLPTVVSATTNQKQLMSHIDYDGSAPGTNTNRDAALNAAYQQVMGDWEFWRWHAFAVHGVNDSNGDPITFGLEVCLEHMRRLGHRMSGPGVLRHMETLWPAQTREPMPKVDVHLVTSCGMELDAQDGITARVGGYAAICDGMRPGAGAVWPTTDVQRVTAVEASGVRRTNDVRPGPRNMELPVGLQLCLPGQAATPKDSVAIWEPVDYRPCDA
ncbi:hypothetical protein [Actinokineospora pegani]|uniref:hypothetical protein n=1 Tax=Actinokineospora pegani TaxID=2654637 RepID=UPI0012EA864E|nr:hypothetical protein [Actinokineospora pegani]